MLCKQCFPILRDKVVNFFIVKTSKVVNFFTVTIGKQIQCQVVKKFVDIHNYDLSDIKVGKRTPFTIDKFDDFFKLLPDRADSERSWTVGRDVLEERNLDLKAINPNRKAIDDIRTPEKLISIIEEKQIEISKALADLKGL